MTLADTSVAPTPLHPGLFLALAPMDGVTDWVYRDLLTGLLGGESGISLCVSEFVRVTQDPVVPKVLLRHCPELAHGSVTAAGTPVYVQLLGGDPEPMAHSAALAASMGAMGIDLNFGCPAKTVNNHDGGATILKTPQRVERITAAVRAAVPPHVPVTVKVRLGWDSSAGLQDIARAAQAGGAAWLTIHARTRLQLYRPPVDWVALGRAGRAVEIPVVANGDICTPADLLACAQQSGCRAFMIGRGSMGRPHLFAQIRSTLENDQARRAQPEQPEHPDMPWMATLWRDYVHRLMSAGASERAALGRLKQWLRLGAPAFEEIRTVFDRVKRMNTLDQALTDLEGYATRSTAA